MQHLEDEVFRGGLGREVLMSLAAELLMAARRYDGHSGNIEQPVTRIVGHDEIAHGAYWETLPHFTAPATKLWKAISPDAKKKILSNVWRGKCRREVTITNFSGAVRGGDLLLVGRCAECQGDVARVIESG